MRGETVLHTRRSVFTMAKMVESVASRAQTPFENAPFTDFTKEENRRAQMEALEQVKSELGQTYPLIIGGKKITKEGTFASGNPSQPNQGIGYFLKATVAPANEASQEAPQAFERWRRGPPEGR